MRTFNIAAILVLTLCSLNGFSQTRKSTINIDSLIQLMTIEEKVGQMTQVDLGVIAEGDICNLKKPQTLDLKKLNEAISTYSIGSILNVGCGSGTISLDNWHSILTTIQNQNKKLNRLNIPIIYGIDAIHGVNYTKGATLFPQQIGQAATWNPALVEKGYQVTAYETRATGIPWTFSPVLDLGRQPLWSRFFETFGEDVYLAKTMTQVAIRGLEGNDIGNPNQIASCMKHFLGYSVPLSGKDRTPAWISDRELREYFLPTFQEAIRQGSKTVMINSGEINGTPVHVNYDILTKLLRDELGFKGVVLTDWEDIYKLVNIHRVASTKKEATRMAIMAGIDMSMTPNDFEFTKLLIELVKEGTVPIERINASVKRILLLKSELGLFTQSLPSKTNYPLFGSKQYAELSYQTASESITLLKNEKKILPLNKANDRVLVCGPSAQSLNLLNGAWTHTWLGNDTVYNTPGKLTILKAIQNLVPKANVEYAKGCSIDSVENLQECIAKAKKADKIIICLGETPATEVPGNINDLSISPAQQILFDELSKLNKPIILVCCFNRPRIIKKMADQSAGILYAYLPGDEGGRAIADCLYGNINPSGKLPFTYPSHVNSFVHYDHKASEDLDIDFSMNAYKPLFDFGHGLSYTQFEYGNLSLSNNQLRQNDSVIVTLSVKNIGNVKGQEVVQAYYNDKFASITPSVKKLFNYQKISLDPKETKEVKFVIYTSDLSFINKNLERVTEEGEFEIMINNKKLSLYVKD